MKAALGLPIQKRVKGHHILDFHGMNAKGRRDRADRRVRDVTQTMLNRLDDIHEPGAVCSEFRNGGVDRRRCLRGGRGGTRLPCRRYHFFRIGRHHQ